MPKELIRKEMTGFLLSIDPDKCWTWQGEIDNEGNGIFNCIYPGDSQKFLANRSAMIAFGNTPVYPHEDVVNTCQNKLCCNPKHLRKIKRYKCLI